MQQFFAEGVNGLDFQSAGRLHRAGEQSSGEIQRLTIRRRRARRLYSFDKLRIFKNDPFGEMIENPLRHIRRRRLGVGETEDLRRRRAREQQTQHTLRQNIGFTRACMG